MRSWFPILVRTVCRSNFMPVNAEICFKATFGKPSCHLRACDTLAEAEGSNGYWLSWRLAVEANNMSVFGKPSCHLRACDALAEAEGSNGYWLSWRLAVEANNMSVWRTVPPQFQRHVESYMTGGQYERDLKLIIDQVTAYANGIAVSDDGMDAWILDIDDTIISNMLYYKGKRYGCDPFDAAGFKAWAVRGEFPAIPAVLGLFKKLVDDGFKVIFLTARDQETLRPATFNNLRNQGFDGYERLIMKTQAYKGQSAITYKSDIRS
ncbi:acid phosphatase 1 isoform X2 [Eucalyptus grandis]|uniref:acid phosphatase 1 isoform X2 n=1 Tax=Eucalyptus grandis TaxID=71139 RepID=UPI00192EDEAB|nr:acid phosphatase 1 isoform X2 [Eucalyptus grandis]